MLIKKRGLADTADLVPLTRTFEDDSDVRGFLSNSSPEFCVLQVAVRNAVSNFSRFRSEVYFLASPYS